MLTPEKLSAQKFDKVLIWGYDMNAVDNFLEQVEADYTTLYNENAALTEKLKYLTGKVDEYRQVDEAMRKALLQAQNIANDTIAQAREESVRYKESVREGLMLELKDLTDQIQAEKKRLEEARRVTRRYIDFILSRYTSEVKILSELRDREFSDMPAAESVLQPEESPTAESVFSAPIPTVSLSDDDLKLTKIFSSVTPKSAESKVPTEDTLTVPLPISFTDDDSESSDTQTDSTPVTDTDVPVVSESVADAPVKSDSVSSEDSFPAKPQEVSKPDPFPKSEGFLNPFWEGLWDSESETNKNAEASSENPPVSDNDEFTEDLNDEITLPAFSMSASPRRKSEQTPKSDSPFLFSKLTLGKSGSHAKSAKGRKK